MPVYSYSGWVRDGRPIAIIDHDGGEPLGRKTEIVFADFDEMNDFASALESLADDMKADVEDAAERAADKETT